MTPVWPPRNLPGKADDWGRALERDVEVRERNLVQFQQKVSNWRRSSAGSLAVMSRNIEEVSNRDSESVQIPDMTATGSATSEPFPRSNHIVSFPPTPGERFGRLILTGNAQESTPQRQARAYAYLLVSDSVVGAGVARPFQPFSTPVEWLNNQPIYAIGAVPIPGGSPLDVTVRLVRAGDPFSTGSSTVTLTDLTLTLTRTSIT